MPSRTRKSRVTMPTTSVLPPCELAITILRKPARCTPSPISNQLRMRLSAEWVMVPPERRCSSDFPIVWVGRNSTRRSPGRRASTVLIRPSAIAVSVMTGRCGPCCSVEATGRIATVALGSSPANSLDLSSAQNRLVIMSPSVLVGVAAGALAPRGWYSKSPGRHCTAHSGQIESAHAQEAVLSTRGGRRSSSGKKHALACCGCRPHGGTRRA